MKPKPIKKDILEAPSIFKLLKSTFGSNGGTTPKTTITDTNWKSLFLQNYSRFYSKNWCKGQRDSIHLFVNTLTLTAGVPNQIVKGELWIRISKPTSPTDIKLALTCTETKPLFELFSGLKWTNYIHLNEAIDIFGDIKQTIEPGEWRYPFQFTFPKSLNNNGSLPGSFSYNDHGTIRYCKYALEASLHFVSASVDLEVLPTPPDIDTILQLKRPSGICKEFKQSNGTLKITLIFRQGKIHKAGSPITVTFTIDNNCPDTISQVTLCCQPIFDRYPDPPSSQHCQSFSFPPILPGTSNNIRSTLDANLGKIYTMNTPKTMVQFRFLLMINIPWRSDIKLGNIHTIVHPSVDLSVTNENDTE